MKKFRSFLKWMFIILLLLTLAYSVSSMVLSTKVVKKISELKTQGEIVSLNEYNRKDIPDDKNGAIVYMKIFEKLGIPITINNGYIDRDNNTNKRTPFSINYNEFRTPEKISNETWNETRKIMAEYQEALDMVDDAISKPEFHFPVNWDIWPATVLPHFAALRELSRRLVIDSLIAAHDGDMNKVLKRTKQIIEINDSLDNDQILITYLVRLAILSMGVDNIKNIDKLNNITKHQAMEIDDLLSKIELDRSYTDTMKGERAASISILNKLMSNDPILRPVYENNSKEYLIMRLISLAKPFIYLNQLSLLDYMEKIIDRSRLSYRESIESKQDYKDTNELPYYAYVAKQMIPAYSLGKGKRDEIKSNIFCCQIYLRLIMYKEQFGKYPETLAQLSSISDKKTENDPLSGKEFAYKRKDNGFILYSVGYNMRDDGGIYNRGDYNHDDIIWERLK